MATHSESSRSTPRPPRSLNTRPHTRLRRERGQASTEFAIVATVFVPVLLFSCYFYDLLQIKLKVQEAARFAAFEWANKPLHDFTRAGAGNPNRALQSSAKTDIENGVQFTYRFLNSSRGLLGDAAIVAGGRDPRARLSASFTVPDVTVKFATLPIVANPADMVEMRPPLSLLRGVINSAFNWLVGQIPVGVSATAAGVLFGADTPHASRGYVTAQATLMQTRIGRSLTAWGFPTEGEATVTVSTAVTNDLIPRGGPFRGGAFGRVATARLRETYQIYVDTWRLPDGNSAPIDTAKTSNPGYYAVVDAMKKSFIGPNTPTGLMYMTGRILANGALVQAKDPTETRLVSIPYTDRTEGTRRVTLDSGATTWNTGEFRDEGSGGENKYKATLNNRGQYFMGCPDEAKSGCFTEQIRR